MTIRVDGVSPPIQIKGPAETASGEDGGSGKAGFEETLGKLVDATNADQIKADRAAEALARGTSDDLHGTMISMKEAEISLKLVGTVRNKLLDAFHELWRINV
jgi:flagellar hook-basal body complex protein FliE